MTDQCVPKSCRCFFEDMSGPKTNFLQILVQSTNLILIDWSENQKLNDHSRTRSRLRPFLHPVIPECQLTIFGFFSGRDTGWQGRN